MNNRLDSSQKSNISIIYLNDNEWRHVRCSLLSGSSTLRENSNGFIVKNTEFNKICSLG